MTFRAPKPWNFVRGTLGGRDDALCEELDAIVSAQGGEWELRVQLCVDLETMPIEDASVVWDEAQSPFRTIDRIKVAPQRGWSEEKSREIDDGLTYSPWHGLAAHQPLGTINRVRRGAYAMSSGYRTAFNHCPIYKPGD